MIIKKTPGKIEILTPAKVNLCLEVLGVRPDGYHEICSLIDPVSLYDRLVVERGGEGVEIVCKEPGVPTDSANTVAAAWEALRHEAGTLGGARVLLEKNIPTGGGLGGGSSNAAAMLVAMNELFSLGLSRERLARVGEKVGSDVPFFFAGQRAWVRGRGETVEPVEEYEDIWYILVFPGITVPTSEVYNKMRNTLTSGNNDGILKWKHRDKPIGKPCVAGKDFFNRLEQPAFLLFPSLAAVKKELTALHGSGVVMSGSGSCFACICSSDLDARRLEKSLSSAGLMCSDPVVSVRY
jgi:4-diphosphocytidyl-2-C-methyl-D-erythritol kinase